MTRIFLAIAVVGAVTGLFYFRHEQRLQLQRLQAAKISVEDTAARAEHAEQRSEKFKRELLKLQAEQLLRPVAAAPGDPAKAPEEHPAAKLFRDPEMRAAMKNEHLRAMERSVNKIVDSHLVQRLNLTPEQTAALKDLVQKKHAHGVDLLMALMSGDASELPKIGHAAQRQRNEAENEIRSLLGEENYQAYAAHEDSLAERQRVTEFRRKSEEAGSAITADQEAALVQAMVEERQNFQFVNDFHDPLGLDMDRLPEIFGEESLERFISEMEQLNNLVILRAQSILGPQHSGEFAQALRDHFEQSKMTVRMTNALFPVGRRH